MSDLPADTLTTTIAPVLTDAERESLDEVIYGQYAEVLTLHDYADAIVDGVERILADRAAAVVSVLATHNEQAALRLAADELESAHRSGEEVGVSWWWLRDRADRLAAVSPTPPTHKEQDR